MTLSKPQGGTGHHRMKDSPEPRKKANATPDDVPTIDALRVEDERQTKPRPGTAESEFVTNVGLTDVTTVKLARSPEPAIEQTNVLAEGEITRAGIRTAPIDEEDEEENE